LAELAKLPRAKFEEFRRIGSPALVDKQLVRVALAAEMQPKDARDVWAKAGNPDPAALTAMPLDDFRKTAKRLSV
jgi:malonate decarboxylase beta subunit